MWKMPGRTFRFALRNRMSHAGKRFYRASGEARAAEMINRLGIAQAVDFGGGGGPL